MWTSRNLVKGSLKNDGGANVTCFVPWSGDRFMLLREARI
jgi:hypothetical protein